MTTLAQITNYSTLQAAVRGFFHGEETDELTLNIPVAIQLLEAELNDDLLLKDMESEESLTLVIGQNYVALPTGYVRPIALWLVINNVRTMLDPALPQELPYDSSNGQPRYYAIDGANIRFDCPAASAYAGKFRMVKKSNLSTTVTSNALLLRAPDVYLYGTLKHIANMEDDDRKLAKWGALYERAKERVATADNANRSHVPMRNDYSRGFSRVDIRAGE